MNCRDFLVEIGTEEIPARMLARAAGDLESLILAALDSSGLSYAGSECFFTPRRLAVLVKSVPDSQADREDVVCGPSVAIALQADGSWSPAAAGFARGKGFTADDLIEVDSPKGRVVALRIATTGKRTLEVLPGLAAGALSQIRFPKSMRWADGRGPFVRPVHWICCLFGSDVVDFEFIQIRSGNVSFGHRFLSGGAFVVSSPEAYVDLLRERHVIVRQSERVEMISAQRAAVESETGLTFVPNDSLFDEISNIIEKPHLITCGFDPDFLRLPVEVLTTAMAAHQRYFAMQDSDGRLTRTFGVVCNNRARDMAVVARGNERVLAARLYDCRFFYENDLKTGLDSMGSRLGERLFLKDAGSMADKVTRVAAICRAIAGEVGLSEGETIDLVRAANLCKADLMSSVVGELPEVQGIMGSYYATAAGESPTVAAAVREHYLPRFAGDVLPSSDVSAILAVADRLDSIITCFSVGAVPTGSKDPLALRRQAIALLRIVSANQRLRGLTVPGLLRIDSSVVTRPTAPSGSKKEAVSVEEFFAERFRGILGDEFGVGGDVANAVIDMLVGPLPVAPADLASRAVAIRDAIADKSFRDFLDNVFKRVGNLVRKADEELPGWRVEAAGNNLLDHGVDYSSSMSELVETELEAFRVKAAAVADSAGKSHDYAGLLRVMASFEAPLARFIGTGKDGVPVLLEKDQMKRLARLALLDRVFSQFNWFADFSKISTR